MSSPFRLSDRSPSSQRSTPSRSLPNSSKRKNGFHKSTLRDGVNGDSPSRQLLEDFGKMMINDDKNFKRSLDEQTAAQQKLHIEALERALTKHREVRDSAERTRERIELEILKEKQRREDEEKRAVEKAKREIEEQNRRMKLEEERAKEEERKRQDAIRREEEESRRKAAVQKQRDDEQKATKDRQEKEDADRRAREAAEARQKQQQAEQERQKAAQQAAQPPPQVNGVQTAASAAPAPAPTAAPVQQSSVPIEVPDGVVSSISERETTHKKYLDLHKRLKQMRKHVMDEVKKMDEARSDEEKKKGGGLKNQVSDWRRQIQKCCGQLGKGQSQEMKESNRQATKTITDTLSAAAQIAEPSIDITQYLVDNQQPNGATTKGPGILLFLLNQFAKKIISQFMSESAADPETADVIGILAVNVFAHPNFHFNGQSLIDVMWAKYHKVCPVLFGITGSEESKEGRLRLGWYIEGGAFVREEEHYSRNSGLGSGFAAVALRDFSRSKNSNPVPNRIYWEAVARILNTPQNQTSSTQCVVLKAMTSHSIQRILTFFGGAGLALLRQALIYFPNERAPKEANGKMVQAAVALTAMPLVLQRDHHLTL